MAFDGRELREQWDKACDDAAEVLRRHIGLAEERGDDYLATYLRTARTHLVMLHISVNGRRSRPGRTAPGIIYDAPEDLWREPYTEAGEAISAITQLFASGLGATGWDWSRGFPPSWPTSVRDRLRFTVVERSTRR